MRVYEYGKRAFAPVSGGRVMALGFFDGVHIGHRALLSEARKRADADGVPLTVFTFRSESKAIKAGARLYTTDEKLSLLGECGADETIVADFDDMRELGAEDFVRGFLIGECGCTTAVTGKDFRFGIGAAGNVQTLTRIMREHGRDVLTVDDVTKFGKKVSTTVIREYLAQGSIVSANVMLGSPYFIGATVQHGRGVGRTLGYPTLNCELTGKEGILQHGVYLSLVELGGVRHEALTNIGTCPTFDARAEHAETFLLGFDGEAYGESVRIYLLRFLREERTFGSAEELTKQISLDIEKAKKGVY